MSALCGRAAVAAGGVALDHLPEILPASLSIGLVT